MGNKKNLMSIVSLVAVIVALIIIVVWPDGDTVIIGLGITILLSIVAIACGFIGKSQIKKTKEKGKGLALTAIILGFIVCIFTAYTMFFLSAIKDINFNDPIICPMVSDCVDNGDGTSTCSFVGAYDVPCSTKNLTSEQFKK